MLKAASNWPQIEQPIHIWSGVARGFCVQLTQMKGPRHMPESFRKFIALVVVVMNDRLGAIAVRIFLLDHGSSIAGLALLDHRGPIAITIMIVGFADCHAGADRP